MAFPVTTVALALVQQLAVLVVAPECSSFTGRSGTREGSPHQRFRTVDRPARCVLNGAPCASSRAGGEAALPMEAADLCSHDGWDDAESGIRAGAHTRSVSAGRNTSRSKQTRREGLMEYQEYTCRRVRALDGTSFRVARKGEDLFVNGMPARISALAGGIVAAFHGRQNGTRGCRRLTSG